MTNKRAQKEGALLNKQEVADRLHISTKTLDRLRAQGAIEEVAIRRRVLFRPEAVAVFIAENSTK
jgi:excisionase family DNA binding protein